MCRIISLCLLCLSVARLEADVVLKVHAGGHARENCPVTFPLPDTLSDTKWFKLVREDDGSQIPVQRFGGKSPKVIWMIHDRMEPGSRRSYRLVPSPTRIRPDKHVTCKDDGRRITVSVDDAPVMKFNHGVMEAPEGIDSIYRRSGYIHPVYTPQGNVVTGDFEKDHPHQHGVFNAWVNAHFRDAPVDFWNQAKGKGDVEFKAMQHRMTSGPVFAQFTVQLTHVAVREGKRVPAIDETWQVRVYNSKSPFLFEIFSRQSTATEDPVIVNEYHYGGFGMRGPAEWLTTGKQSDNRGDAGSDAPATGGFLTSEGRTRADGNHTRARWVDMHGPIGSQHAGLVVMGAMRNFRAPQTVRLHPNKPYFCFAPMALGEFKLESDTPYSSRFRFASHDGPADATASERLWQDFAHPPKVIVK